MARPRATTAWPGSASRERPSRPRCRGKQPNVCSYVDAFVYTKYGGGVGKTTTIRISRDTHAQVSRLATERHETIDETVRAAIRALRQDAVARDLARVLTEDETAWLDADAG